MFTTAVFFLLLAAGADEQSSPDPLLKYVPPHATALLLASPQSLIEDTEQSVMGDVAYLGQFAVPPSQIERMAVLVDLAPHSEPGIAIAFRFTREFPPATLRSWLSPSSKRVEGSPFPLFRAPESFEPDEKYSGNLMSYSTALAIPGKRTAIVSFDRRLFDEMLASAKAGGSEGVLVREARKIPASVNFATLLDAGWCRAIADGVPPWRSAPAVEAMRRIPKDLEVLSLEAAFGTRTNQMKLRFAHSQREGAAQAVKEYAAGFDGHVGEFTGILFRLLSINLPAESLETLKMLAGRLTAATAKLKVVESAGDVVMQFQQAPSFSRATMQASHVLGIGVSAARRAARHMMARNNMKMAMLAWLNYSDRHGRLPEDIYSDDGKPLLSWRVRILPYLEEGELFKQFRLNEPWDSPHNKALLAKMPSVYSDVFNRASQTGTRMQTVVGKRTTTGKRLGDITDGLSNTVAIVDAAEVIPWTKPDVLTVPESQPAAGKLKLAGRLRFIGDATMFAFTDGSVSVTSKTSDKRLWQLLTVDDGQVLDSDDAPAAEPGEMEHRASDYEVSIARVPELLKQLETDDPKAVRRAALKLIASRDKLEIESQHPMMQVLLGILNYSEIYGHNPADSTGKDGAAQLSWRVHLLPFIDEGELYKQFHFDEPWDSDHNKTLIARMPSAFRDVQKKLPPGNTRIQQVTGPGTASGEVKFKDVTDGTSATALLVEARDGVAWTKPGGLPLQAGFSKLLHLPPSKLHTVGMFDGAVLGLDAMKDEDWQSLLVRNDGKSPDLSNAKTVRLHSGVESLITAALTKLVKSPHVLNRMWAMKLCLEFSLNEGAVQADARPIVQTLLHDSSPFIRRFIAHTLLHQPRVDVELLMQAPQSLDIFIDYELTHAPAYAFKRAIETLIKRGDSRDSTRAANLKQRRELLHPAGGKLTAAQQRSQAEQISASRQLLQQGQQLLREGKTDEAMAALMKMLAIERKVYGDTHKETHASVRYLLQLNLKLNRVKQALGMSALRVKLFAKEHGADHYITRNAKSDLIALQQNAMLTAEQRKETAAIEQLRQQAVQHSEKKEHEKAVAAIAEAISRKQKIYGKDSVHLLGVLRNQRNILVSAGKPKESLQTAQEVVRIVTALLGPNAPTTRSDRSEMAYIAFIAGDKAGATKQLVALQQLPHPPESTKLVAQNARNVARWLAEDGILNQAGPLFMKSITLFDEEKQQSAAGGVAAQVASHLSGDAAHAWRNESVWRYSIERSYLGYLENYPALASQMQNSGRHHLELVLRKTLVEVLRGGVDSKQVSLLSYAKALSGLAGCYIALGDFELAAETLRQCEKVTGDYRGDPFVVNYLTHRASVAAHLGDFASSEKLLQEAARVTQQQQKAGFLQLGPAAFRRLAEFYAQQQLPARAIKLLESAGNAQNLDHAEQLRILAATAETQLAMKQPGLATATARRGGELLKKAKLQPTTRAVLLYEYAALWLLLGDAGAARPLAVASKEAAAKMAGGKTLQYVRAASLLARIEWALNKPVVAARTAREALHETRQIVETTAYLLSPRQQLLFGQSMRESLDLFLSIASSGEDAAGDCFAEIFRWKGAGMVRQREVHQLAKREGVAPFYQQVAKMTQQLSAAMRQPPLPPAKPGDAAAENFRKSEKTVDALSHLNDLLQSQLSSTRLAYMDAPEYATVPEFIASLPNKGVFIDYLVVNWQHAGAKPGDADNHAKRVVLATVITKDGRITLHNLGDAERVAAAIQDWRNGYGVTEPSSAAGQKLHTWLWQPIAQRLAKAETILISPDDILGQLPFHALPAGKGRYLIEDHRMAIVAVPQQVPELLRRKQPATTGKVLLVGDVDYEGKPADAAPANTSNLRAIRGAGKFQALPGTREEVEVIQKLFTDANQQPEAKQGLLVLTKQQASENAFRQAAGTVNNIHIATHGFFAPAADKRSANGVQSFNPGMLSGLVLAGANTPVASATDDGVLTADEVSTLDMEGVDLAVLSACETGLGRVAGGEGLLGIQRSFQVSGVGATVASLWQVPDQATRVLMERFYRNHWGKKMSRLDALREAQIFLLNTPAAVTNPELVRGDLRLTPPAADGEPSRRLTPQSWAAFSLSGDWR